MNLAKHKRSTPRISSKNIVAAQNTLAAMSLKTKEKLVDEIFLMQPSFLGTVLVQPRMGVSIEKVDFLLRLLLQTYLAMRESGGEWPTITEDELAHNVTRISKVIDFQSRLKGEQQSQGIRQYGESHPEPFLFSCIIKELNDWEKTVTAHESDRYVILAAITLCESIARAGKGTSSQLPADIDH